MKELLEALAKSGAANASEFVRWEVIRLQAKYNWSIAECEEVIDFSTALILQTCESAAETIKAAMRGVIDDA
jgi:Arc/MetJ-type ribon-helix-helix transcriptional regulator